VPGAEQLISCDVCRALDGPKSCNPLLVGGEVIGSVLLSHGTDLTDQHRLRVKDSVTQAAPVLANLRNLAIAQLRAATDALSGLPNARAVQDTLKRLVAQASRMLWPLSAVLLDLDHFKEVNDTFGHGLGDEVLAAVGAALRSTVRESDFVGRYGGEEFVMLLPDTDRDTAVQVAERVRTAIGDLRVLEGDSSVSASFGIAVFPEDAPSGRGSSGSERRSSSLSSQGQRLEPCRGVHARRCPRR
jgi:diguanylate cyclase (GGDEF)-like protein